MSQENVQTLRRLIELWARGPTDVPTDLVAPEIEFVSPLTDLRGRPYRGYDEAREWMRDVREQFETWEYTVDELREAGDAVLALGHVHLKGRGSGVVLDQTEPGWPTSRPTAASAGCRSSPIAVPPSKPPGCGSSGPAESHLGLNGPSCG
jgi:ketosteroid isomerase-like protein